MSSVAAEAAAAHRALQVAVARADGGWSDEARRQFEADHLRQLRADSHALSAETEVIAELLATADRLLGQR